LLNISVKGKLGHLVFSMRLC